jgi:hypothetical protein
MQHVRRFLIPALVGAVSLGCWAAQTPQTDDQRAQAMRVAADPRARTLVMMNG